MVETETEPMSSANSAYQVQISDQLDDPGWDAFLASTPGGSYQQTSLWARAKKFSKFRVSRVLVRQGEKIVAGAQMLIRSLPLVGAIGYVPRGPVLAPEHGDLARRVIDDLHQVARKERVRCLVLQAPAGADAMAAQILDWGFCPTSLSVAPNATLLVDLDRELDTILASMRKTTRYDIRSGEKKGTVVRLGTEEDLGAFYRLFVRSSERQNFSPEPLEYYRHLWGILAPPGLLKLFLAEVEGEPVSASLVIAFGDSVVFWRSGWSGSHSGHHANEVVQWHTIKWAKSNGHRYYDLGGIGPRTAAILQRGESLPNLPDFRGSLFKMGFGGKVAVFPKSSAIIYNRLLRWGYEKFSQTDRSRWGLARIVDFFT
jgi:lipid II:glycine glycyltransferase (peptidoglycan interpeptide bridge formation enzyme)